MSRRRCLVTGAGGFIGGHLVHRLLDEGSDVTALDVRGTDDWWQVHDGAELIECCDLRRWRVYARDDVFAAPYDEVYHLAADMGGIGYIETHRLECALGIEMTVGVCELAKLHEWKHVFYASSACVYPAHLQNDSNRTVHLRESDAFPADAEPGYGWEKLYGELLMRYLNESEREAMTTTSVARYHNVYGPHGTWIGGREKAPAAICRKIAEAKLRGTDVVQLWGDGTQTRTFTYVDDAVEGTLRIARSGRSEPLNVGTSDVVTILELGRLIADVAGVDVRFTFDPGAPFGVRGRSSHNERVLQLLDWEPRTALRDGLARTYDWVAAQVERLARIGERWTPHV